MSSQFVAQAALAIVWLVTTIAYVTMLYEETQGKPASAKLDYGLTSVYAAVLLWYLVRSGPSFNQLPDFPPLLFANWQFGPLAIALVIALLFCLPALSDKSGPILFLLYVITTLAILVAWRKQVTAHAVVLGTTASLIAFAAGGILFWKNEFVPKVNVILFLIFVPPMFIVGSLLLTHIGWGRIQLLDKQYGSALISFLWGGVLFIPLGLANALDRQKEYPWIKQMWKPLAVPFWSGINEETTFRLFLIPLCYALLHPTFNEHPILALIAAVLFSGITFGLMHGQTWKHFWSTGLCYGLPMAVIFVTQDWEHTVGAHYMVNFIPWVMAFLKLRYKTNHHLEKEDPTNG